jgi:hypothetical protein
MSGSEVPSGFLEIKPGYNPVPYRIYNGYRKLVRQGIGPAREALPFGLYSIVFDGLNQERTVPFEISGKFPIASLAPGIDFPTVAPIHGNRFSHEYHANQFIENGIKDNLAILGRSTSGDGKGPVDISDLMLIDKAGTGLRFGRDSLVPILKDGCQIIHWDLAEGDYFLCSRREGRTGKGYFFYQPIPVIPDYMTCVFLPCLAPSGLPIREAMTIHFVPRLTGYDMSNEGSRQAVQYAEIMIQQQREGRRSPLSLLEKLADPELARLDLSLPLSVLTQLSYQMDNLDPDSNDSDESGHRDRVVNLMRQVIDGLWEKSGKRLLEVKIFAESLRKFGYNEFASSVTDDKWTSPPLLATSLRILLEHDLEKACIEEGSLLEEAYVGRLQGRPYTSWKSLTAPDALATTRDPDTEGSLAAVVKKRIEKYLAESAKFSEADAESQEGSQGGEDYVRKICGALRLPFNTVSTMLRGMDSPVMKLEPLMA